MTDDRRHALERLEGRGRHRGAASMLRDVERTLRRRRRTRRGVVAAVLVMLVAGGVVVLSGDEDRATDVVDDVPPTTTAPSETVDTSTTAPVDPPAPFVADPCATGADRFADAQFAFVGTVVAVEPRVNPRDVDPENPTFDPDAEPPLSPWVWFAVEGWFTDDRGVDVPFWMPGLEPEAGQRLLVAGDSYAVWLDDTDYASGEVLPCLAEPATPDAVDEWNARFGGSVVAGAGLPEGEPDPLVVAELEAALDRWRAADLQDYSADVSLSSDQESACARRGGRLVVEAGVVVESVPPLQSFCDPIDGVAPSVDAVFEAAIASAGAANFDYVLDDGKTLIWFAASDRAIRAGGAVTGLSLNTSRTVAGEGSTGQELAAASAAWVADPLTDYELRVDPVCCWITGPYTITVVDGVAVAGSYDDGEPVPIDAVNPPPLTIEHFYAMVDAFDDATPGALFGEGLGERGTAKRWMAVIDPSGRWPERLYLDWLVNAIDDEQFFEIEVRPTDPVVRSVLIADRDLAAGTPWLTVVASASVVEMPGDVAPASAISPIDVSSSLGRVLAVDVAANQILTTETLVEG